MCFLTQHINQSANGDRWSLVTDTASGRKVVRHEANQSSGGHVTDTEVDDFLAVGGSGPGIRRIAQPDRAIPERLGVADEALLVGE